MIHGFHDFTLDQDRHELRRAGQVVSVEPKVFQVLLYLLQHRDRVVTKDERLEQCWPGMFVSEAALTRCMAKIRQAVQPGRPGVPVIKTVHGQGYRFVAAVEMQTMDPALPATPVTLPPPSHTLPPHREREAARATKAPLAALRSAVTISPHPAALVCPQCQTPNRAARQFCAACGHALWQPCPHCGFSNSPTEHFCGGCGHDMAAVVPVPPEARTGPPRAYTPAHLAAKILTGQQRLTRERKLVTILVASIEGLWALRQAADPEAVDDVLNQGFAQLVAEIHRVEGFVLQVAGQGVTALFGAPLACEDHVLRALHAALGIQRAFAALAAELRQTHGVSLTLRLGVHTGPVVVNAISQDLHLAYTAPGTTVELATGLQYLSRDGAIYVSEAVQQEAVGFFRFVDRGTHALPDVPEPVHVYVCAGVGAVTSRLEGVLARGHTIFHGRTQELALLEACWARVRRGAGQVVCLVGEAGIGKSRLAYEFQQTLGKARRLTAQSLSYGQAMPYHAIIPLLRTVLGVVDATASTEQHQALHTRLEAIDSRLASDAPLLAHLLGVPLETEPLPALEPEARRRRLQLACLQVLVQQAADTPPCLLVEDGHWLDPSSQEMLDLLVAALARRPIMVLCTARPGFRHAWADYTYFHQVAVEPLPVEETDALLRDLLRPYEASTALKALIHERTRGNPFFVEELVRTLQMHGLLTLHGGVYEVKQEARRILSASIQGIAQTRLDRLPATEKHLLQVAAVIGPEVPVPLLQACMGVAEETLDHSLTHVQALEFLYETRPGPVRTYTFKHALVQDAAYASLLKSTRQQYHQRIAQVLAECFPETAETQPELIAQHYTAAGLHAEALPYWQRAGDLALKCSAYREAVASLERGLEALPHLPQNRTTLEQAVDLRLTLRSALLPSGDWERILALLREAESLATALEDSRRLGQVLLFLSLYFYLMSVYDQSITTGERALALATTSGDVVMRALANDYLGRAYRAQGDYRRAIDCFGQTVAALDGSRRHESYGQLVLPAVYSRAQLAECHTELGEFAEGAGIGEEGLRIVGEVAHPRSFMYASEAVALGSLDRCASPVRHGFMYASKAVGLVSLRRGNLSKALPLLERAVGICQEADLPVFFPGVAAVLGAAYILGGRVTDAVLLLTQALEQAIATETVAFQALCTLTLGEAQLLAGHLEEAHALAEGALVLTHTHQERGNQAYTLRLLGDIAARREPPEIEQAEAHYQHALALANELGMRPLLAHCHFGLGTLYAKSSQPEQARPELSAAMALYRAMEMTFWLPQAEATLAQVT